MRYLQAGQDQLIGLEPDHEMVRSLCEQAEFSCEIRETDRLLIAEVRPASGEEPLLLFDAADAANIGWFSRCHFYVDGFSGCVLQTPLVLANVMTRNGEPANALHVGLRKELPTGFRLPGKQALTEPVIYALMHNFLVALRESGVAVCGGGSVRPIAGGKRVLGR